MFLLTVVNELKLVSLYIACERCLIDLLKG